MGGADDFAIRSAEDIVFSTNDNNTPNLKLDTSGRLMIGSAAYIGGAALAVLGTGNTPNTYGSLAIGKVGANPTSGTTLANIRLNGGSVGTGRGAEINAIADANWSDGSSHPTYLTVATVASSSTSATERIRVHAGGNVDIKTGSLVISTAGQGISFAATGDFTGSGSGTPSEILDDYEEGTYTAHFSVEGQTNMTMQSRVGIYTKIGRMVHVIGGGTVAENPPGGRSTSAAIQFTNLPFTSKSLATDSAGLPFPVNFLSFDSTGLGNMAGSQPYVFGGRLNNNSTAGRIIAYKGDGDQNPQNASLALVYNSQIFYMFSYVTDA